eukprot:gene31435-34576_t
MLTGMTVTTLGSLAWHVEKEGAEFIYEGTNSCEYGAKNADKSEQGGWSRQQTELPRQTSDTPQAAPADHPHFSSPAASVNYAASVNHGRGKARAVRDGRSPLEQ